MSACLIIQIEEILNLSLYKEYTQKVKPVVETYGGTYMLVSDKIVPFSGDWVPLKVIIIRFESLDELDRCFHSNEYLSIKLLREQSTKGKAIIIK